MVFTITTYTVQWDMPTASGDLVVQWAVSETDLEAVVKVLRWNGIKSYSVREGDPRFPKQVVS